MARKAGKPIPPDTPDRVIDVIQSGVSMREACRRCEISPQYFLALVHKSDDLKERYARAREACYDMQVEEMNDLEDRVLSGEIEPNAFRAAMDARKWRLARMMPKKYGDKVSVESSGPDGGPIRSHSTIEWIDPRDGSGDGQVANTEPEKTKI